MTFGQAVGNCFRNYVSGQGRAGRPECFWWMLFTLIIGVVAAILNAVAGTQTFGALAYAALLLPSVAVGIRRLHDTDRPGPWMFLAFLPVVGTIILLIFFLQRGTAGANRFGEPLGLAPVE